MDRYSELRERIRQRLTAKTSWGRNELFNMIDEVLLATADDELEQAALQPPNNSDNESPPWSL